MIKFLKDCRTARPTGNHITQHLKGDMVSLPEKHEKELIAKKYAVAHTEEEEEKEKIPGLSRKSVEELVELAKEAGFDDAALDGLKRAEIIELLK